MKTEQEIREKIKELKSEMKQNNHDGLYCVKLECALCYLQWVLYEIEE